MKKINFLIILGLFVLLVGMAQPAQAGPLRFYGVIGGLRLPGLQSDVAHLNAAASKFEGLLNAYSINQNRARGSVKGEVEVGAVAYDSARSLSNALEQFNLALVEVYPTLSEDVQLAVKDNYSLLGLYLEDLTRQTNSVFGKEILRIEYEIIAGLNMNVLKSEFGDIN